MKTSSREPETLLRVRDVLLRIPVSKATWWRWVHEGYAPRASKIGRNVTCWRGSDIDAFIARIAAERAA